MLTLVGTLVALVAPHRVLALAMLWARTDVSAVRADLRHRLEVVGRDTCRPGPALIASKHQSAFDTMVWLTLVPRCCYVLKQELLRIPLFGALIRATGMIAVDRPAARRRCAPAARPAERGARRTGRS